MSYQFDFAPVVEQLPYLLQGALVTLGIAFFSFSVGAAIGVLGAVGKTWGTGSTRRSIQAYVVFVTNTPALVQIFFLFYGLPAIGLILSPLAAVLIGLSLNSGAYLTEIIRGGMASVRQSEMEAAAVLGLSRAQTVRHVVLPHVLRTVYGPLASFFIWLVLGSSMAALFGVEELTGRALNIGTASLRTIETFSIAGLIYVALTALASSALALFGRVVFGLPLQSMFRVAR